MPARVNVRSPNVPVVPSLSSTAVAAPSCAPSGNGMLATGRLAVLSSGARVNENVSSSPHARPVSSLPTPRTAVSLSTASWGVYAFANVSSAVSPVSIAPSTPTALPSSSTGEICVHPAAATSLTV